MNFEDQLNEVKKEAIKYITTIVTNNKGYYEVASKEGDEEILSLFPDGEDDGSYDNPFLLDISFEQDKLLFGIYEGSTDSSYSLGVDDLTLQFICQIADHLEVLKSSRTI